MSNTFEATLSEILRKAFYAGDIPFGGVLSILPDGKKLDVFEKGFLSESIDTFSSGFWIASLSKGIASVAAMILVEKRLIGLDDLVGEYIEQLKDLDVLEGFGDGETPLLRKARTPITLRHLLCHTAGFAYPFSNDLIANFAKTRGLPPTISGKRAAYSIPLVSDPGSDWVYGISTDWLGQVIEKVSGCSLDEFYKNNIFDPLGMKNTFFKAPDDFLMRTMPLYRREDKNAFRRIELLVPQNPEMVPAGAGLYSCPEDYLRFLEMLLREGRVGDIQVLEKSTVKALLEPAVVGQSVGCIESSNDELTLDYDPQPGVDKGWSLGFSVTLHDLPEGRKVGSFGWAGLSNIYYWVDPKSKLASIFYTQVLPFADTGALRTLDKIEKAIYRFVNS